MEDDFENPFVVRAVKACGDSQSELARRIGGKVRQGHVCKWLKMRLLSTETCVRLRDGTKATEDPLDLDEMLQAQVREIEQQQSQAA